MQLAHAVVHHMVGPIEARGNLLDLRIGTGLLARPDCFCQQALVFLCPEKTTFPALCIACWPGLVLGYNLVRWGRSHWLLIMPGHSLSGRHNLHWLRACLLIGGRCVLLLVSLPCLMRWSSTEPSLRQPGANGLRRLLEQC